VVSSDMSGHAVTVGPRRGIGRILSTWAGYPAPAVLGAAAIQIALSGWVAAALLAATVILVVSLVFTRSVHTLIAVAATAAALGAVWWWGGPQLASLVTLAAGVFLLLGRRGDDPAQLAQLTWLPAWVWSGSFALVLGVCTWWAWTAVGPSLL